MATGQLALYNIALRAIGERSLDSLSEEGEPRRELDAVWSAGNGAVRYFLEQGFWNFAIRAQRISSSTTVEPDFGYTYAFDRPTDMVRLAQISADEYFSLPLNKYELEVAFIFADVDPLYVRFVSDDASYGADYSLWPETFTLWAGHWLATQIAPRLCTEANLERLEQRTIRLLGDARSKDAAQEPTRFPPLGSWASARLSYGRYYDRKGSRLIG